MAVLVVCQKPGIGTGYVFYCPGCKCNHSFDCRIDGKRPSWTFDGDIDRPTFSPSLHYPDRVCHLFVKNGQIQFLSDCTHELAGKTVEMEAID
jgi:hypothetical protein